MYDALSRALGAMLTTVEVPDSNEGKFRWFASNGMSVCFERGDAFLADGGLVEVATPECLGSAALAVRLRAIDGLLLDALPVAEELLAAEGTPGSLGLVKHGRDPDGAVYGRQQNVEVTFAEGWRLGLWKAVVIAVGVLHPPALVLSVLLMVGMGLATLAMRGVDGNLEATMVRIGHRGMLVLILLHEVLLRVASWVGFRRVRAGLEGFLVSQAVVTGTGHHDADGRFWLSGRAEGSTTWITRRLGVLPEDREHGVFATGNLVKPILRSFALHAHLRNVRGLMAGRQRLQLSVDSHRCEVAEVLAVGTLERVVALVEDGRLDDAPRFADPLAAMKALAADATLTATVTDLDGRVWTGLALQRFYQERVATAFPDDPVARLWGDALDGLASDRSAWIGRIDWVTKAWLLDQVAADADPIVRKRVDVQYHELGSGLFDRVLAVLDVPSVLDPAEIQRARTAPPDGPAHFRGALIEAHGDALTEVGWDRVRLRGKVIWLRGPPSDAARALHPDRDPADPLGGA